MPILINYNPDDPHRTPILCCEVCFQLITNVKTACVAYSSAKGLHAPRFVHTSCVSDDEWNDTNIIFQQLQGFFPSLHVNCDIENTTVSNVELN